MKIKRHIGDGFISFDRVSKGEVFLHGNIPYLKIANVFVVGKDNETFVHNALNLISFETLEFGSYDFIKPTETLMTIKEGR